MSEVPYKKSSIKKATINACYPCSFTSSVPALEPQREIPIGHPDSPQLKLQSFQYYSTLLQANHLQVLVGSLCVLGNPFISQP